MNKELKINFHIELERSAARIDNNYFQPKLPNAEKHFEFIEKEYTDYDTTYTPNNIDKKSIQKGRKPFEKFIK